jgi:hypothetical protein
VTTYRDQVTPAAGLNGRWHRPALLAFLFIVLAHWAEHIAQAIQIWGLDRPRPKARGLLGGPFPTLVTEEWLHYGYALIMLIGFIVLRKGFVGRAHAFWVAALVIQFWHHFEHLLLFIQAMTNHNLDGKPVPTSILQLWYPRVELHLFYNTIVFIPMVIAMILHLWPSRSERERMTCSCLPAARV